MKIFNLTPTLRLLLLLVGSFLLSSCAAPLSDAGGVSYESPAADPDLIRFGDTLIVRLEGVPVDDQKIFSVPVTTEGWISLPLLGKQKAAGKSIAQLQEEIEVAYRRQRIYQNPVVIIRQSERFVNTIGEVRNQMRIPYTSDLTVLGAISASGGFTEYAKKSDVRILRQGKVILFDAREALRYPQKDRSVKPGDQIQVPRTIF